MVMEVMNAMIVLKVTGVVKLWLFGNAVTVYNLNEIAHQFSIYFFEGQIYGIKKEP